MKIKLYTLTELKKMHAKYMEKDNVYGIRIKDYQTLSRHPRKVTFYSGICYEIENWQYIIPYEYVKEIINEN